MANKMLNVGGLWRKTSQKGVDYLSGSVEVGEMKRLIDEVTAGGETHLALDVFKNEKKSEKSPDYGLKLRAYHSTKKPAVAAILTEPSKFPKSYHELDDHHDDTVPF